MKATILLALIFSLETVTLLYVLTYLRRAYLKAVNHKTKYMRKRCRCEASGYKLGY